MKCSMNELAVVLAALLALDLIACGARRLEPVAVPPDAAPPAPDVGFGLQPALDASPPPTASCATQTVTAQRSAADLLLLVDVGPSIHQPFPGATDSKFFTAKKALFDFLMDPQSAGMGVALQFFPFGYLDKPCNGFRDCGRDVELVLGKYTTFACTQKRQCAYANKPPGTWIDCPGGLPPGPCSCALADMCAGLSPAGMPTTCAVIGECSVSHADCVEQGKPCPGGMAGDVCGPKLGNCNFPGNSCDPTMYEELAVPFADLPAAAAAILARLDLTDVQSGNTSPTTAAVKGALAALRKRAAMPGARPAALVLVTQARAAMQTCAPDDPLGAMTELAGAVAGTPSIPTYVIGLLSADNQAGRDNLGKLATAGGTAMPFVLDKAEGAIDAFQKALDQIRTATLPCEMAIPAPSMGALDYGKVNVTLTGANLNSQLGYSAGAGACKNAGGWYYDVDPSVGKPGKILLCPSSCQAIKGDLTAKAQLVFGCATRLIQ